MTKKVEVMVDQQTLRLMGELDFNNVMPLYHECVKFISSSESPVSMDFSGLTATNSAAIALIVNCMHHARRQSRSLTLLHIPQDVMSLAKASGLDDMIGTYCH